MSAILKFDFEKKKTITFSEEIYIDYTKKDAILHVTTTFSQKQKANKSKHAVDPLLCP